MHLLTLCRTDGLTNGKKAVDGFAALSELDKNGDGAIDSSDEEWKNIKVWTDNGNGVTQEGEIKTLEELGIVSLNLKNSSENSKDAAGNDCIDGGTMTRYLCVWQRLRHGNDTYNNSI